MKRSLAATAILAFAFTSQASAQQVPTSPNHSAALPANSAAPPNTAQPQSKYDPLAGRTHFHGGLWDGVLNGINPSNQDLGQCLSDARTIAVRSTLESVIFWIAVASMTTLFVALFYIYWLLTDRARRLDISVTVLTQIANAYIDARDHAHDAIRMHNRLADDYNVLAEKASAGERQKEANQHRVRRDATEIATLPGATDDASPNAPQDDFDSLSARGTQPAQQGPNDKADRRYANQISALQEKNKTLRASLNDVLAENDRLKRERTEMRGA